MTARTWGRSLVVVLIIGVLLRLYNVTAPLADWHSFRQADTASVTREYAKHGIDLMRPRYHDLSNIQSGVLTGGKDNLQGWRMVEFPIVNAAIASLLRAFPAWDLVVTSRIASIVASSVSLVCLGFLITRIFGRAQGIVAAAVFAVLPYSVFYSRVILPEPFLVCFLLVSLYSFLLYQQARGIQRLGLFVCWVVALALAFLLKPMAVFMAPVYLALAWHSRGWKGILDMVTAIGAVLAVIPVYLWRQWITQFPEGIPWSVWLYNLDGIRLRPAWFRWLFYERLTKLLLGIGGVLLFVAGLWPATRKLATVMHSPMVVLYAWGLGMLAYLIVFATGNVRHDYYQVLVLPFVCVAVAVGLVRLWEYAAKYRYQGFQILLVVLCVSSWLVAYKQVRGYYAINHPEIMVAGKAADRVLPADAKVIAPYNGDTAFLFQTNRTGWPIGFEIEKKVENGAQYYVSVNYDDETTMLMKTYPVIEKTDQYVIIDLTTKGTQ